MAGSTCDDTTRSGRKRNPRSLREIKAEIARSSPALLLTGIFVERMRKHANSTESFCSDADNLGATSDRT
jgi:hypothetical protein